MPPTFLRPARLPPGSCIAALSLSSGFVTGVMGRSRAGARQVADVLGWEVMPPPNALRGEEALYAHPQARADDLHWALEHPEIDGLLSVNCGDDSVRLLPFLDLDVIRAHPKPFVGFSDSTVTLLAFLRAGVMAYHGPALLTDLAENGGMHPFTVRGLRRALVDESQAFDLSPAPEWSERFSDWGDGTLQESRRPFHPGDGWQ